MTAPVRGGHAGALLVLLLALAGVLLPPLLSGRVLYGHRNEAQVGAEARPIERDEWPHHNHSQLYVPETRAHLECEHVGWPATWNPHNELGRPLIHLSLGTAFGPFRLLSWLTRDAYLFTTLQSLLAVVGTAVFAFGFLRSIGCGPVACVAASLGISIGPLYPSWQAYTMVQWGYCWAFASLWAAESWLARRGVASWIAIAFSVHAVTMTGFPQHVLLLGWIVAGWVVWRTLESKGGLRAVGPIAAATGLGLVASLPLLADLFVEWSRSARADYTTGESLVVAREGIAHYLANLYGVFRDGDVSARSYSLSPLYASLVVIALAGVRRWRGAYWGLCAVVVWVGAASPHVAGALRALGLSLSNWSPVYGALLPCTVLAARGVDLALGAGARERKRNTALCGLLLAAAVLGLGATSTADSLSATLGLGLGLGACLFAWTRAPLWLVPLLAVAVLHDGRVMTKWQERSSILETSPIVEALRERTADGSRFAWIGGRIEGSAVLEPNVEILVGLASVHTYYHLQSRAYAELFGPLVPPSERPREYERRFEALLNVPEVGPLLRRAGVSTLVARRSPPGWLVDEVERFGPIWIGRTRERGPLRGVVPSGGFRVADGGRVELSDGSSWREPSFDSPGHDRLVLEFERSPEPELLFLSRQFHPHWRARSDGEELETVAVDGFYQGVLLPPGTERVELAFEPWIRLAWWPQVGFALAAAGLLLRRRSPQSVG